MPTEDSCSNFRDEGEEPEMQVPVIHNRIQEQGFLEVK